MKHLGNSGSNLLKTLKINNRPPGDLEYRPKHCSRTQQSITFISFNVDKSQLENRATSDLSFSSHPGLLWHCHHWPSLMVFDDVLHHRLSFNTLLSESHTHLISCHHCALSRSSFFTISVSFLSLLKQETRSTVTSSPTPTSPSEIVSSAPHLTCRCQGISLASNYKASSIHGRSF